MKTRSCKDVPVFVVMLALGFSLFLWIVPLWIRPCFGLSSLSYLKMLSWVEASRPRVYLADLCDPTNLPEDWYNVMASMDLGPAPHVGSRKYIRPDLLKDYLSRFLQSQGVDVSSVQLEMPESITIERKTRVIPLEEIEREYKDRILTHSPWNPDDLVIERVTYSGLRSIPAGEYTYEIRGPEDDNYLGNVSLVIDYFVGGERARTLRVNGKVSLMQDVVHSSAPLSREDLVRDDDIKLVRINVGDDANRFASDPRQVINKQLRRDIDADQPISLGDVSQPIVVKRGDPVTIFYETPGFRLTVKGEVKESAAIGDRIRVLNATSKRTVYCQVVDSKTVTVVSP